MGVRTHESRHDNSALKINNFLIPFRPQVSSTIDDLSIINAEIAFLDGRRNQCGR
jgi:hypothetical protein